MQGADRAFIKASETEVKDMKEAGAKELTAKAKIVAKDKSSKGKDVAVGRQEYTSKAIEPAIRVLIKQGKAWTEVDPTYYSISYINNLNKGKAVIVLNGNGSNAIGSKKSNFTITNMSISQFSLLSGK